MEIQLIIEPVSITQLASVSAILRVTIGEDLISLFSTRGPVGLSEKIVRIGFEEGQWEVLTDNCCLLYTSDAADE